MRDLNRIPATIENFQKLWQKYPDFRFGQLFDFIKDEAYNKYHIDPFFIEEKEWNEVIIYLLNYRAK